MSGINEIKKKTKLTLDEMYGNQSVGNLNSQEEIKQDNKQFNKTAFHGDARQEPLKNEAILDHASDYVDTHKAGNMDIHPSSPVEAHLSYKQDFQEKRNNAAETIVKQQQTKAITYKMTFSLTEEAHKAFNDLYALRMINGRKTEKSVLICEAIDLLTRMEKSPSFLE